MSKEKENKKENKIEKAVTDTVKKIKVQLDYRTVMTIKETALAQWLVRYPKAQIIS